MNPNNQLTTKVSLGVESHRRVMIIKYNATSSNLSREKRESDETGEVGLTLNWHNS
jgi:hypothetical protein